MRSLHAPASGSAMVTRYNWSPSHSCAPGDSGVDDTVLARLRAATEALRAQGLYKTERVLASAQQAEVRLESGAEVVNLCANNYLGLANHPAVVAAAAAALREDG